MRMTFWARVSLLNQEETRLTPKDMAIPNINTGSPVPMANTAGNAMPPADLRASGIKTPKYKIAL